MSQGRSVNSKRTKVRCSMQVSSRKMKIRIASMCGVSRNTSDAVTKLPSIQESNNAVREVVES